MSTWSCTFTIAARLNVSLVSRFFVGGPKGQEKKLPGTHMRFIIPKLPGMDVFVYVILMLHQACMLYYAY